jgi:DNA-binding IclR family transcriptional regulator
MTAVVDKLFRIVDCIATRDDDAMSLAELTRETGIPKATLYRLLGDLIEPGIIAHAPEGYALGGRLFDLGSRVSPRDAAK